MPLFTLAFKFPESASDIQLPTPLSFITQFAAGEGCVSAPCIQLVRGIANGIGKPIHLETWISDRSLATPWTSSQPLSPTSLLQYAKAFPGSGRCSSLCLQSRQIPTQQNNLPCPPSAPPNPVLRFTFLLALVYYMYLFVVLLDLFV